MEGRKKKIDKLEKAAFERFCMPEHTEGFTGLSSPKNIYLDKNETQTLSLGGKRTRRGKDAESRIGNDLWTNFCK